jgi:hypothetical protein
MIEEFFNNILLLIGVGLAFLLLISTLYILGEWFVKGVLDFIRKILGEEE